MESYIKANADHMVLTRNRHFVLHDTLEDVLFISHIHSHRGYGSSSAEERCRRTFRASYATKSAAWTPSLATTAPAELIWTCVPLTPTQFQELSKKGRPFHCRRLSDCSLRLFREVRNVLVLLYIQYIILHTYTMHPMRSSAQVTLQASLPPQ